MRAQTIKSLSDTVLAGWGTPGPFPLFFDNAATKETGDAWGRVSIWTGERLPAAIGKNYTRILGIFRLQAFIPEKKGAVIAQKAADSLDAIFQFKRFKITDGGLTIDIQIESGCKGPEFVRTENGMSQYAISFNFRADGATA